MSTTTGPVLATGITTIVNRTVFNGQSMDWRVPIATGLLVLAFNGAERVWPQGAQVLAWTGFITLLFSRTDPRVPSPVESAYRWWQEGQEQ